MSNLPLRRTADLLREIIERCDTVLPRDQPPLEGAAFDEWVRNWIIQNPLGTLLEEAASLLMKAALPLALSQVQLGSSEK
jgi:hypothetical protein